MPKALKVYVAGPYSRPDPVVNTRTACLAADELLAAGLVPFVPHLSHLWHLISPKDYEVWLTYDLYWVRSCDALLRLPGESAGADREVKEAQANGLLVFRTVADVVSWAEFCAKKESA